MRQTSGKMALAVYVLACRGDNYYIDVTDNVEKAFMEHYMGIGSEWTRLHTPERVARVVYNAESYHESALLRDYFLQYGVDHVRGGPYNTVVLSDAQRSSILASLAAWRGNQIADDVMVEEPDITDALAADFAKVTVRGAGPCARCGNLQHRARECYASYDINGNDIMSDDDYSDYEIQ